MAAVIDKATISISCSGPGGFPLPSKTEFGTAILASANMDAQITAVTAVATAIGPLTNGVVSLTDMTHRIEGSTAYPSGVANRGQKWLLTFNDNVTGDKQTTTIPAASALTADLNSDNVTANLTSAHWAAFKTAIEAVMKSPRGNAVTLLRAKLGGRRA